MTNIIWHHTLTSFTKHTHWLNHCKLTVYQCDCSTPWIFAIEQSTKKNFSAKNWGRWGNENIVSSPSPEGPYISPHLHQCRHSCNPQVSKTHTQETHKTSCLHPQHHHPPNAWDTHHQYDRKPPNHVCRNRRLPMVQCANGPFHWTIWQPLCPHHSPNSTHQHTSFSPTRWQCTRHHSRNSPPAHALTQAHNFSTTKQP